jgi:hypothetical protein
MEEDEVVLIVLRLLYHLQSLLRQCLDIGACCSPQEKQQEIGKFKHFRYYKHVILTNP